MSECVFTCVFTEEFYDNILKEYCRFHILLHILLPAIMAPVIYSNICFKSGVFNLSDSAGHINNFNCARGPQSYTAAFRIVSCFPDTQRTTCILYVTM
jgi:hypothetical protein